jgi:hypothetical protein
MATNNKKITPETENQTGTPPEAPIVTQEKPKTENVVVKSDKKKEVKMQGETNITELILAMQKQILDLQEKLEKTDKRVDEKNFLANNTTPEDVKLHQTKAERMKANLESQPKVRIMINLEGKEVRGKSVETVILNGYRLNIPKGVYVDVPQQVADVIANYQSATEDALHNKYEINDGNRDKTDLSALEG